MEILTGNRHYERKTMFIMVILKFRTFESSPVPDVLKVLKNPGNIRLERTPTIVYNIEWILTPSENPPGASFVCPGNAKYSRMAERSLSILQDTTHLSGYLRLMNNRCMEKIGRKLMHQRKTGSMRGEAV